jgi:hypothetical protein
VAHRITARMALPSAAPPPTAAAAAMQKAAEASEEARAKKAEAENAALLEAAKKEQASFAAQQMASKALQETAEKEEVPLLWRTASRMPFAAIGYTSADSSVGCCTVSAARCLLHAVCLSSVPCCKPTAEILRPTACRNHFQH